MFTGSLLESSTRARRGWTTLLCFAVQSAALAVLVLLPLFYMQSLPAMVALRTLIGPPPGEDHRTTSSEHRSTHSSTSEIIGHTLREPIEIRKGVADLHDLRSPEPLPDIGVTVPGAIGSGAGSAAIISVLGAPPKPVAPPPAKRLIPVSAGVLQGFLLRQVRPVYPPLAIAAHVQGAVVLSALISRAGTIENLRVVSGHPMLVQAALEAVRQWRYRPYRLNREPVEVETQITVTFTLGGA